jgi:hypothetical protein
MTLPLTACLEAALGLARYDKLEDGSFAVGKFGFCFTSL